MRGECARPQGSPVYHVPVLGHLAILQPVDVDAGDREGLAGGIPRNSPTLVPEFVHRTTTLSPSAIRSSMVKRGSSPLLSMVTRSLSPCSNLRAFVAGDRTRVSSPDLYRQAMA